ncbi:MAG: urease accessory protein UreD [Streptosporangiales bacterium]|nr:urease accessory protein UreD [Streptosporangiales bacterium]
MRARAVVRAEADAEGHTRLTALHSEPPLVLRPTRDAVYVAAGAAGPIGGDDLELSVTVGEGTLLHVRTVAATVALPGAGESSMTWRLHVAAGARLVVAPEPTVVATGARHCTRIEADVDATGFLTVREEVQLGRYGEPGGVHRGRIRVDVAGTPLLRHELTLDGTDPVTVGRASAIGARAYGSLLTIDPTWTDERRRKAALAEPGLAVLPLAGPGVLVTALDADARLLRDRLDRFACRDPGRAQPPAP